MPPSTIKLKSFLHRLRLHVYIYSDCSTVAFVKKTLTQQSALATVLYGAATKVSCFWFYCVF